MRRIKRKLTMLCMASLVLFVSTHCGSDNTNKSENTATLSLLSLQGSGNTAEEIAKQEQMKVQMMSAFASANDGSFTFDDTISFSSGDGTNITGNLFVPKGAAGLKYPAVIFVNSWALNEYEYLVPAATLAKKGYVVLSYNTRGFGTSGGLINVAGPKDMEDLTAALNYLEANSPVDSANIGIAGISYGAGISLIGASTQSRIKTAVSMSGWSDLGRSLYGNETPRLVWGIILIGSGYITGHMDPIIAEQFQKLLSTTDVASVLSWANDRSAKAYINQINAANKPVYISNNLNDELFYPNPVMDYFAQLTGPKKMDLNEGIHATAEIGGILGLNNYVWTNAYDWFDYWLKGVNNGIMSKPQVTIQRKFGGDRVSLASWPAPNVGKKTYYLHPRNLFSPQGKLKTTANTSSNTTTILSGLDTVATTGIPIISPIVDAHADIPVFANMGFVSLVNGIVYESDFLSSPLKICGKSILTTTVAPSISSGEIMVYLYDVDFFGNGKLITYGTGTIHGATPGANKTVSIDLSAVAHTIPSGHRLSIAIDTFDPMYASPTLSVYSMSYKHSSSFQSTLVIDTLN